MPKRGENISLKSFDDIFSTEESRQTGQQEQVKQMIEENTVMYSTYQVKIPALKMGRLSDIYPDYE